TDDFAAGVECGIGDGTHQANVSAAKNDPIAGISDIVSEILDCLEIRWRIPGRGPSKDREPPYLLCHAVILCVWLRSGRFARSTIMRVLPRVFGLTRARSRNSATPSSVESNSWLNTAGSSTDWSFITSKP